ncbi:hypothetical protein TNCV_4193661 [Trichonephila clavipes]|nr:hypothetical protein TNCV_4193661 [Trichonephila clavipes]
MLFLIVHSTCGFHKEGAKGTRYRAFYCAKKLENLNEKLGGAADFKASTGWVKSFKSCHGIRELQIDGESLSGDKISAFSALATAMAWYEYQSECCATQLLLLQRIRDLAAKKRSCIMVQRKISDYFPQ